MLEVNSVAFQPHGRRNLAMGVGEQPYRCQYENTSMQDCAYPSIHPPSLSSGGKKCGDTICDGDLMSGESMIVNSKIWRRSACEVQMEAARNHQAVHQTCWHRWRFQTQMHHAAMMSHPAPSPPPTAADSVNMGRCTHQSRGCDCPG